jgi:hypothetical protein
MKAHQFLYSKNYLVRIMPHSWDENLYQAHVMNEKGDFEIIWNRLSSLDEAINKIKKIIDGWDEIMDDLIDGIE